MLQVHGIGKETADSILLYVFNKPIFVIDAYTRRIFSRLLDLNYKSYDEWQTFFESNLAKVRNKVEIFKEYHALLVEHAKRHCKVKPKCEGCCLSNFCKYAKNLSK